MLVKTVRNSYGGDDACQVQEEFSTSAQCSCFITSVVNMVDLSLPINIDLSVLPHEEPSQR